ncbi:hypothetical protein AB0N17_45815 [Streptomyces sp. NPDC051133]|uniref:hypothetical protein n=1 Tax=Streptomyces sp. NPDC051133 TaxID=3155521 RepID=UPI003437DB31
MSLPASVPAPRICQRNLLSTTEAELGFLDSPERNPLEAIGHHFVLAQQPFTPSPEIGAIAGLEFGPQGSSRR